MLDDESPDQRPRSPNHSSNSPAKNDPLHRLDSTVIPPAGDANPVRAAHLRRSNSHPDDSMLRFATMRCDDPAQRCATATRSDQTTLRSKAHFAPHQHGGLRPTNAAPPRFEATRNSETQPHCAKACPNATPTNGSARPTAKVMSEKEMPTGSERATALNATATNGLLSFPQVLKRPSCCAQVSIAQAR